MRWSALLLVPLFVVACDREPVAPDAVGPSLSASGEHRAIVVRSSGECWLFDGAGNIIPMACRNHHVYTDNTTGFVKITVKTATENPTGRAVRFTPDDNPIGPDLCGGDTDPEGNFFLLCDWKEQISASGEVSFEMWGIPIYMD